LKNAWTLWQMSGRFISDRAYSHGNCIDTGNRIGQSKRKYYAPKGVNYKRRLFQRRGL